jgi:hypothetical protein
VPRCGIAPSSFCKKPFSICPYNGSLLRAGPVCFPLCYSFLAPTTPAPRRACPISPLPQRPAGSHTSIYRQKRWSNQTGGQTRRGGHTMGGSTSGGRARWRARAYRMTSSSDHLSAQGKFEGAEADAVGEGVCKVAPKDPVVVGAARLRLVCELLPRLLEHRQLREGRTRPAVRALLGRLSARRLQCGLLLQRHPGLLPELGVSVQ